MTQPNWLQRLKRDHIDPIVESISDNLPIIVATATTAVAVGIALKASNDAEHTKEVLASIEEKINTAIEAPTIVRVELGDDLEVYGQGNRTD